MNNSIKKLIKLADEIERSLHEVGEPLHEVDEPEQPYLPGMQRSLQKKPWLAENDFQENDPQFRKLLLLCENVGRAVPSPNTKEMVKGIKEYANIAKKLSIEVDKSTLDDKIKRKIHLLAKRAERTANDYIPYIYDFQKNIWKLKDDTSVLSDVIKRKDENRDDPFNDRYYDELEDSFNE